MDILPTWQLYVFGTIIGYLFFTLLIWFCVGHIDKIEKAEYTKKSTTLANDIVEQFIDNPSHVWITPEVIEFIYPILSNDDKTHYLMWIWARIRIEKIRKGVTIECSNTAPAPVIPFAKMLVQELQNRGINTSFIRCTYAQPKLKELRNTGL